VIPSKIEPATFRFVAQYLNHCTTISLPQFHGNTSSKSRVVPYGQTDGQTDKQTGMTKLIVAICNFADVPKTNDDGLDRMWKEVAVTYFKALSQYWTKLEEPTNPIHDTTALKKNGARHSHE
jgi:hypothetical protein